MGFLLLMITVWAIALGAWFVITKYVKSSDVDRIKARLSGTTKAKKAGAGAGQSAVIQQTDTAKNKFAQLVVKKYGLAPKLGLFLEQAGLSWQPARFVHLSLVLFLAGFGVGWLLLPSGRFLGLVTGLLAATGPFFYVNLKRKARLKRFEELFPETLEFMSRSMRAGHAFSVSLEMIHKEFQEPISGEFRRTFEEHNLGLPVEIALEKLATRVP